MSNIRSNRFYNDPNIGAAFSNLAQLFAPPSAQDIYAYARAKAEREQAERETEAFNRMTAEGADPATVDRFGVAIGRFNPTQSFHAVDVKDATDRRDQKTSRAPIGDTVSMSTREPIWQRSLPTTLGPSRRRS